MKQAAVEKKRCFRDPGVSAALGSRIVSLSATTFLCDTGHLAPLSVNCAVLGAWEGTV